MVAEPLVQVVELSLVGVIGPQLEDALGPGIVLSRSGRLDSDARPVRTRAAEESQGDIMRVRVYPGMLSWRE